MYICRLHIDGFGMFHNQGVQSLPNGIILFLGDNESGKTTLMEFIRMVLFGFHRRGSRNNYPPLGGGNHSGRIQVVMKNGQLFTIERGFGHVAIADEGGDPERVEPSERLLGGINRQTFERIFAIGLRDMQGLDVLSQENVRGRLIAAGAGLGAASVPVKMQDIDNELRNLLTQRGKQASINQIVNRLTEIEIQVKKLHGQASEYAEYQREREQLEARINQCNTEEESIRQRLMRIEQLTKAREHWVQSCSARDKMVTLVFAKDFPPNGLERFESLRKEIENIEKNKEGHEDKAKPLSKQRSELSIDQSLLLKQEGAIDKVISEKGKLESSLEDLPEVRSSMAWAEEEFQRRLKELGTAWYPERLAQLDTSVQVRQQVPEFGDKLSAAMRNHESAQAYLRIAKDAEVEAKRRAGEAKRRLDNLPLPLITDEQKLQLKKQTLRMISSLLHKRDVLNSQLDANGKAKKELQVRLKSVQKQMEALVQPLPSWAPIVMLIAGLGLSAFLATQHSYVSASITLLGGVILAVLFHMLRRRQVKAESTRLAQLQEDRHQIEQTQQLLDHEFGQLKEQVESITKEIERLVREAEIKQLDDIMQLEQLNNELEGASKQLQEWRTQEREKKESEDNWFYASMKLEEAEQDIETKSKEHEQLQDDWKNWLIERGLSDTVSPEGFEAVLQAVESARTAQKNLNEFRSRVNRMEEYIAGVRQRIITVLDNCGRKPLKTEVGVEDLDALFRDIEVARETKRQQEELKERLELVQKEIEKLSKWLDEKKAEVRMLMNDAGVTSEEDFRRQGEYYHEWCKYDKQMQNAEMVLLNIAGTPKAKAALETELNDIETIQLQTEREKHQADLERVTNEVSKCEREVGRLNQILSQMSQDERLSTLLLEQRTLQERLSDGIKHWASLVVCRHLLGQAQSIYEREQQPRVIQEANRFINIITNKRYRIISPVGEAIVQLEDAEMRRKNEIEWSTGLAEQVYLSIRLGLASEFGRQTEPLPIILDDVLVNFDPTRQLGVAKAIMEFGREQQVLLFSCHPEIKQIILEAHEHTDFPEVIVACYTLSDGVISYHSSSN